MVKTHNTSPPEQGSFPLECDGSDVEELLKAGKYDWVAHYSRQIIHSKATSAMSEGGTEIVLLGSERSRQAPLWEVSEAPDIDLAGVFHQYDPPNVWDVLRFGALYPDEQRKAALIFPHEPWPGPHGPTFILVLRKDATGARGLSYVTYTPGAELVGAWWPYPLVAVRRRGGARPLTAVSQGLAARNS